MEGALKPGERCLVKFEVRGGGRAVLFDGCVVLTTEEQQDSVSPRDVARWTMERTQGGRAVAEEAAKALRMRPGVTGERTRRVRVQAGLAMDRIVFSAGTTENYPSPWPQGSWPMSCLWTPSLRSTAPTTSWT